MKKTQEHVPMSFSHEKTPITCFQLLAITCALMLSGCAYESNPLTYDLRVKMMKCEKGLAKEDQFSCDGNHIPAAVTDIRLFPRERLAVVLVITEDDHHHLAAPIYHLTNCDIWDAENWRCYGGLVAPGRTHGDLSYRAIRGRFRVYDEGFDVSYGPYVAEVESGWRYFLRTLFS